MGKLLVLISYFQVHDRSLTGTRSTVMTNLNAKPSLVLLSLKHTNEIKTEMQT